MDWREVPAPPGAPGERDWGALAHQEAVSHWAAVQHAEECAGGGCELHGEDEAGACESPSIGLGCNACDDCMVREVLAIAWPVIEAAIRSGDFDDARGR